MMEIVKNKEEVKSVMNIIQAFADGKTIQAIDPYDDEWVDQTGLNFKALFEGQYRIKPGQKYRPFKDAIECWTEMRKHKPFSILKDKKDGHRIQILSISDGINLISSSPDSNLCFNFKYRMESCTFDDGAPFGVKVEE